MMAENSGQAKYAQRQTIVPRNMGKNMHRLRNAGKNFSDVIIQTKDGKILPVHKAVLVSASDYFATMFSIEMRENCSDFVEMKYMASEVLETVIDFIYDQPIFLTEENIYDLIDAAEYLQVADLKTDCQKFLLASTRLSNCFKHRFCGKRYNMEAVTYGADQVITNNFKDTSKHEEFKELDYDDLQTILNVEYKDISEEIVFSAIVQWAKHDMDGRQKYFDSLFLSVDISLLTSEFIEDEVLNEILVSKNNFSVIRVSTELKSRINKENTYVPRRIGIIGGSYIPDEFVVFDPEEKEFQHLPQLKFDFIFDVPVAVRDDDKLFVFTGESGDIISLNLKDQYNEWEKVTRLPEPWSMCYECTVFNGFIYLAGGERNDTSLSSVIKYDISNDEWSDVKSMNEGRSSHALVSLNEKLFAIAGSNENTDLKTVEMYDADKNQWTFVTSLNIERHFCAASVFNGRIYVTGGISNRSKLSSVEIYDLSEDIWEMMINELNVPRSYHGSCVVGGKLYVVGGHFAEPIEVYNLDTDEWEICTEMDDYRTNAAVCAM